VLTHPTCGWVAGIPELKITLQQAGVPPLAGFPVGNFNLSIIRSLTPQQAAGDTLAIEVEINTPALICRSVYSTGELGMRIFDKGGPMAPPG